MSSSVSSTLPDGWIMAPSKKFPDRAYYFNVNTGHTVWDLEEVFEVERTEKFRVKTPSPEKKADPRQLRRPTDEGILRKQNEIRNRIRKQKKSVPAASPPKSLKSNSVTKTCQIETKSSASKSGSKATPITSSRTKHEQSSTKTTETRIPRKRKPAHDKSSDSLELELELSDESLLNEDDDNEEQKKEIIKSPKYGKRPRQLPDAYVEDLGNRKERSNLGQEKTEGKRPTRIQRRRQQLHDNHLRSPMKLAKPQMLAKPHFTIRNPTTRGILKPPSEVLDPNLTPPPPPSPLGPIMGGAGDSSFTSSNLPEGFSPNNTMSANTTFDQSFDADPQANETLNNTNTFEKILNVSADDLDTSMVNRIMEEEKDDEPMEWDDIDPGIIEELRILREKADDMENNTEMMQWVSSAAEVDATDFISIPTFVVVDTNVFISQLSRVSGMISPEAKHDVIVFVPWAVLRELDILKDQNTQNQKLERNARKAIAFLHETLKTKCPRLRGQTVTEERAAKRLYSADNMDDRILQSCLQLRAQGHSVILLTNDRNLANKALVSQIEAFSSGNLEEGLKTVAFKPSDQSQVPTYQEMPQRSIVKPVESSRINSEETIKTVLKRFEAAVLNGLGSIIVAEMKEAYGDIWMSIVIIKPKESQPFWNAKDLFKCLDKHWIAVFSLIPGFNKMAKERLDQLGSFMKQRKVKVNADQILEMKEIVSNIVEPLKGKVVHSETLTSLRREMNKISEELNQDSETAETDSVFMLFNDIWSYIYKFVCAFEEQASSSSAVISPQHMAHLERLVAFSSQMADRLYKVLVIHPHQLSVTNVHFEALYCYLTGSGFDMNDPDFPSLRQVPTMSLLHFAVREDTREKMQNGLEQIQELQYKLERVYKVLKSK